MQVVKIKKCFRLDFLMYSWNKNNRRRNSLSFNTCSIPCCGHACFRDMHSGLFAPLAVLKWMNLKACPVETFGVVKVAVTRKERAKRNIIIKKRFPAARYPALPRGRVQSASTFFSPGCGGSSANLTLPSPRQQQFTQKGRTAQIKSLFYLWFWVECSAAVCISPWQLYSVVASSCTAFLMACMLPCCGMVLLMFISNTMTMSLCVVDYFFFCSDMKHIHFHQLQQ